jgi:shikimate dehydrogenase
MEKRITGHTELVGLIATPIRHSKSPEMHNAAFAKLGIDMAYLAFDIQPDQVEDALKGYKALNVIGSNVSMPYKETVIPYMDELTPAAKLCHAVNTIKNDNGKFIGHNTDGVGFMGSVKDKGWNIIGEEITVLGAGGAAKAIVVQAALDGVKKINIYNIKDDFYRAMEDKIVELKDYSQTEIHIKDIEDKESLKNDIDNSCLLVNATGVGMGKLKGQSLIPDQTYFHTGLKVFDVIYAEKETKLLQMAKEAGLEYINGERMMLFQGAESFKMWTNQEMPIEYMKEILNIK